MNGPDTHGAFIQGDGFSAFIDGIPDKCQHDSFGPTLWFNDRGEYFPQHILPPYDCAPRAHEDFYEEHNIRGATTSCSKCGKPFQPDINMF